MWFVKNKDEVINELQTNALQGLTSEEAKQRLAKYGENKLAAKKSKSLIQLFFAQLNDAMIYILLGAALISGILGEISDSIIIALVILINAIVGLIQESKAEKALEALKKLSTPKAIVKRDGELKEIASEEVVPGDLVIIDAGRYIPCDLRLIETANLQIEESALTGESVPVDKNSDLILEASNTPLGDQKNMAFMSTLATYGRGVGIAVGTGMDTEIGKIAKMLEEGDSEQTPLQKKLAELGKILGFAALGICAVMFLVGVFQGRPLFEMFFTAISLAVAAIPEGLPAIVTIVLAMGVQRMIKEHAIVRKLPAVETLGSVNIICSDKTGTLTQNKMTVVKFYADNAFGELSSLNINEPEHKLLLENLVLCNDATYTEESKTGDPTEIALLEAGAKFNIFKAELEKQHQRINEIPFDSDRKLMTTVNKYDNEYYVFTKGATDNLLKICNNVYVNGEIVPLTEEIKNDIMNKANSMSDDALRVLGAAFKKISSPHVAIDSLETDLVFIGLIGMIDPPRLEVKDSIALCKKSGIKTIMITGDHKNTAFAIAKELGIAEDPSQAIFGAELDKLSEEELYSRIDNLRVFARVSPEHKVKIVKAFKAKGNIVSMTGDGVNDAPSLKAADIGVAMGITGTDVAKGASDMILTDDNFKTIVSAIEEGRNIYNNIKKSIIFLLSCNTGEIISLFFAILLGWASPLKPIHILWVNLVTDTLPALSLGVDPGDPNVMEEKPRNPKQTLFAEGAGVSLILNGILIGLLTLAAFVIGARVYTGTTSLFPIFPENISEEALTHAQTMAFVVLSVSQLVHSLNMRHSSKSIFQVGWFTNKYLIASVLFGIFLQDVVITVPFLRDVFKVFDLNPKDWLFVGLLSIVPLIVNEIAKIFIRMKKTNN
ncbi:calcium-transporting P-type ATPase, PMR1-type [Clostridium sp. SYSU_GA19001]|uniref:calcium-transporting P-type ATPase, PMR1-type n=1 Tax=Clostridium caldaquaticum TaxID=2940653 RepID=UPI00207708D2|nr:calcium-transporting P-type ATPase, PMR1-type [Clostridium caldaquaticum]MCM8711131.1 calcium-transporting P-type ATPase, PMR1-type [Clostridium caldaquaticum]